jgi:hypothetical protein
MTVVWLCLPYIKVTTHHKHHRSEAQWQWLWRLVTFKPFTRTISRKDIFRGENSSKSKAKSIFKTPYFQHIGLLFVIIMPSVSLALNSDLLVLLQNQTQYIQSLGARSERRTPYCIINACFGTKSEADLPKTSR